MSDILQIIDRHALLVISAVLVFTIIIFLSRRIIQHRWQNLKTRYRLNRLGLKQIADFQCPDGLGHYFTIDRLILRHDGISLLLYKRFPGTIFCAESIDDWTQMFGGQSSRFKNPLYDLDVQIKAVSACLSDVPVDGVLFFDHLTEFPKGHPDRVIHPESIPDNLKRNKNEVSATIKSAWEKLEKMAKG